jgi:hypothetical protein
MMQVFGLTPLGMAVRRFKHLLEVEKDNGTPRTMSLVQVARALLDGGADVSQHTTSTVGGVWGK